MEHITSLIQHISTIILSVGYVGVFIAMVIEGLGLPFPGDAFLAFYGYTVSEHHMNGLAVWSIGTLGYFVGVSIIYGLVRKYDNLFLDPLYRLRILNPNRMEHTANLMAKYGSLVLIPGRFLPGIRSLSTYAAALGRLSFSNFVFYTLIGSMLWCGVWIGLGYWFGENVQALMAHIQSTLMWLTIAILVFLLLVFIVRRITAKADSHGE